MHKNVFNNLEFHHTCSLDKYILKSNYTKVLKEKAITNRVSNFPHFFPSWKFPGNPRNITVISGIPRSASKFEKYIKNIYLSLILIIPGIPGNEI